MYQLHERPATGDAVINVEEIVMDKRNEQHRESSSDNTLRQSEAAETVRNTTSVTAASSANTPDDGHPPDDVDEHFMFREFQRKLHESPEGYPQLAAYLMSKTNGDWMIFRHFDWVRTRLLLEQQDIICRLEQELEDLDRKHAACETRRRGLRQRRLDVGDENNCEGRNRSIVFEELQETLQRYDHNMKAVRDIREYKRPSQQLYADVRRWFWRHYPLRGKESEYIKWREDLVCLSVGEESATFDGRIEALLLKFDCKLIRYLFVGNAQRSKASNGNMKYYNAQRVRTLVNGLIVVVTASLLLLPVIVLEELTESAKASGLSSAGVTMGALLIALIFTILFAAAMSSLTAAKRHELFVGSATYCAILVVFIGNLNGGNGGNN